MPLRCRVRGCPGTPRAARPGRGHVRCHLSRMAHTLGQHSEADPLAVMSTLLAAADVRLGPGPHVQAGDDRHPLLVWPLIIGRTSAGRKGASWTTACRLALTA